MLLAVWGMSTLSVSLAPADGVIRDGIGAISSGRGGTNIAHADNGEILLDNPAGLVNIKGHHLQEFGGALLMTDLQYSEQPQIFDDAVFRPIGLPEVSIIRKSPDGRWAYGLGGFAPAGFGAEYRLPNPDVGTRKYRSFGAMAKVLPGIAYRVNDRLSVGGTFGLALSHAQLQGPFYLQTVPGPLAGAPTVIDIKATGVTHTWSLGLQFELSERTTLGVTYKSESRVHMYGKASVDIYRNLGFGPVNSSNFDARIDITWPRSVGLGIKHDLCDHRVVSADVIWFDWPHAFDSIGMEFSNPSNPLFAGPPIHDDLPLWWRDSVSLRLGYEQIIARDSILRAGYVFHPNPVPDATLTPYIPAILEHAFSLGCGRRWDDFRLDLAYQFSFGNDRIVTSSDLVGGDFDSSRARARAHWIYLSLSRQY